MGVARDWRIPTAVVLAILWVASSPAASATWSIVAVDPVNQEVGSAGASCTGYVAGIVGLAPGRGVLVAQARSNGHARRHGVAMLAEGSSPADVVAAVANEAFDPNWQDQQYGVAALGFEDAPAAFTGSTTHGWQGDLQGYGVSVQGNILTGPEVLDGVLAAFQSPPDSSATLADRLMAALEAGSEAGGDSRCGRQTALSSYLVVAGPEDTAERPSLCLVVPGQKRGDRNPVHVLRSRYDRWTGAPGC